MKIDKETLIKHCSFGLRQIYCPMGDNMPSTDEIAKVAAAVLRSIGIHKDSIESTRRKLKAGGYRYFLIVDGRWFVDPTYGDEGTGVYDGEHPMSEDFKNRGREPVIKERKAVSADEPLTCDHIIKAVTYIPKIPTSKHRDDAQFFWFKLKDLRQQLKKLGILASYDTIQGVIETYMGDSFQENVINGVKGYNIDTKGTLGDWMTSGRTITDLLDYLHTVYVKNQKATG